MKKLILLASASATLLVIFGTICIIGLQIQRSDANWPQVQLATDAAISLSDGRFADEALKAKVDVANSLSPFINIYDLSGKIVGGNGYLDNDIATPPKGVLAAADNKNYSSVTWQPRAGVRLAMVTIRVDNFYVVSGRSLVEVEKNMARTFLLSFVGGAVSLFVIVIAFWVHGLVVHKATRRKLKNS